MIKRRKLIMGGLAVAGIAGLGTWGFGRSVIESEIASVLRKHLRYLKLDEEGLRSFAKDQTTRILAKRVSMSRMRYHVASTFGSSSTRFERSSETGSSIERAQDVIVSTYLLSSDFFVYGSDETRTIRYLKYYDPMHACGNPFARPIVDTPSAT
jgi:hypothetical protein